MKRSAALDSYLRQVRAVAGDREDGASAVCVLAAMLLRAEGVTAPDDLAALDDEPALRPPTALVSPWLLGHVHEALLDDAARRRGGVHYTPPSIARGLVSLAREGHDAPAPRVCDPAAGGGAFLLAAAESIAAEGLAPVDIVRRHCFGGDVDPVAVLVARATLALWARAWPPELDANVIVADAFDPAPWRDPFDLVIGNPPFQNQLETATARDRERAAALRSTFGDAAGGYVDTAALFLLRGLDLVRPGGRVALVQPQSTIVARDAARVRAAVEARAAFTGVWFAEERVFDASVRVWAPVLERSRDGARPPRVVRRVGARFAPASRARPPECGGWASMVADLAGVPSPTLRSRGVVGDIATATAGFRDQFYGLVGAVHEHDGVDERPQLITSGLVEVLDTAWGRADARFARARWRRPVVDVAPLSPEIARWVTAQLVPKLVVATQTKVLECAVDELGVMVPSTPVIAVHAPPEHLWHLAAALSAPPVTAVALHLGFGTALSAGALKLSARQVVALPLPEDRAAWDDAARAAQKVASATGSDRRAALAEFGATACAAYGVAPDALVPWWLDRIAPGY